MILKSLTLENFKGICEPVRIEFAPLTLLFGPNNSGKSTIVQALMYAREVLERNNCDAGRTLLGGDTVDLGGFRSLVYRHDTNRAIRMRFELAGNQSPLLDELDARTNHRHLDGMERYARLGSWMSSYVDHFREACARLHEPWIELEIAHTRVPYGRAEPRATRYAVGSGDTRYAEITLNEGTHRAELSYLNGSVFPVALTSYEQVEQSGFNWRLSCIVRTWLQMLIAEGCLFGLKNGAFVAAAHEVVPAGRNVISREVFDAAVSQIVNGEGVWGDDARDPKTGAHNPWFELRQYFSRLAEVIGEANQILENQGATDDDLAPASVSPDRLREILPVLIDFILNERAGPPESRKERTPSELNSITARFYQLLDVALTGREGPVPSPTDGIPLDLTQAFCIAQLQALKWVWRRRGAAALTTDFFSGQQSDGLLPIPLSLTILGSALPEGDADLEPAQGVWQGCCDPDPKLLFNVLTVLIYGPGWLLRDALGQAIYLGPYRRIPLRDFGSRDMPAVPDWASGLAAWQLLMAAGNRPLVDDVNRWLSDSQDGLGTGYRVVVQRSKRMDLDSPLWEELMSGDLGTCAESLRARLAGLPEGATKLELVNVRTGIPLDLRDLGVGISQAIPVLVAALHKSTGVVAVEEPESNIHPAFQVVLADLFMRQAKANPELLFLVETHSEHLMLRCLRRIRETSSGRGSDEDPKLVPADISVNFVEPDEQGQPRIHRIRVDEEGEFLDPWPRGFFCERSRELYGDDL